MINDAVFAQILTNKDVPFYASNVCNPDHICTWNDVERYINNNSHNSEIVTINLDGNKTIYKSSETSRVNTKELYDNLLLGDSFILNYMERYNKSLFTISNTVSKIFNNYVTTNIYGGLQSYSKSFKTHADSQYVLILHLSGESEWIIFKEDWNGNPNEVVCVDDTILTEDIHVTVKPGDVLYIPYRRYHKCIPRSKRLSASVSVDVHSIRPFNYGDWFDLIDV